MLHYGKMDLWIDKLLAWYNNLKIIQEKFEVESCISPLYVFYFLVNILISILYNQRNLYATISHKLFIESCSNDHQLYFLSIHISLGCIIVNYISSFITFQ